MHTKNSKLKILKVTIELIVSQNREYNIDERINN